MSQPAIPDGTRAMASFNRCNRSFMVASIDRPDSSRLGNCTACAGGPQPNGHPPVRRFHMHRPSRYGKPAGRRMACGPDAWTGNDQTGMNAAHERSSSPVRERSEPPSMKTFLLRTFTWWNGQTFGTQLWTALYGERVGEDEFGNVYYRTAGGKIDPALGFERRWVIYNGVAEASMVPPSWHGWMHHTVDVPPTEENVRTYAWEK